MYQKINKILFLIKGLLFDEENALRRLLELVLIIAGVVGIFLSFDQNKSSAADAAWTTLTQKSTGNAGKRAAIETLFSLEQSLQSINLSCRSNGGFETYYQRNGGKKIEKGHCIRRVHLDGLDLSLPFWKFGRNADFTGSDFEGLQIFGGDISSSKFRSTRLHGIRFKHLIARNIDFSGAQLLMESNIIGSINKVEIRPSIIDSDLTGSNFSGVGTKIEELCLSGTNVSKVDFGHTPLPGLRCNSKAWYWSDSKPSGTDRYISEFKVCDEGINGNFRKVYEKNGVFGVPKNCV